MDMVPPLLDAAERTASREVLLPLPLLITRDIFASLVPDFPRIDMFGTPQVQLPRGLQPLAGVNRAWNALARDVAAESTLSQLRVWSDVACRSQFLEIRRMITVQRKYLQTLLINKVPFCGPLGDGHWEAVFCVTHCLKSIDLALCRGHLITRLSEIVRAAGRQCPELDTVILAPALKPFSSPAQQLLDEFQQALYGALRMWSKDGVRPRVRHLEVGMHNHMTDTISTCAYVNELIKWCPSIERISGYKCTLSSYETMTSEEQWLLDLPTWTRFCGSLTAFTHFEWAFVPFATCFFEVFGQFSKSRLKRLDFTPLVNWKWGSYLCGVDSTTCKALIDGGYAATAVNAHAVLRACPRLEELEVRWPPATEAADGVEASRGIMNPEIFGDDFCAALATYCPRLRVLTLRAMRGDKNPSQRVIHSFTDHAMRSLATLPFLRNVDVDGPNITGVGLVSLFVGHNSTKTSARRCYNFGVGESVDAKLGVGLFYDIVHEFLHLLVDQAATWPYEHRDVTLTLTNKTATVLTSPAWSQDFLETTRNMVRLIQAHQQSALATLLTSGYNQGTCACVEYFTFSVGPNPKRMPTNGAEEQIDDIVYNRLPERFDVPDDDNEPR